MPDLNPQETLDTRASQFPQDAHKDSQPESGQACSLEGNIPPLVELQPSETPAVLDRRAYHLVESLGKGGMGEVYRAGDPALGRDLAVKVMKAELGGHAEIERRFLREARITASLQHPGIVPVHNLGRLTDGRLHYTMRLVRGQTLSDILQEQAGKPEHWHSLLDIFEKVCQAVAYAHSKHVIHRDLKPSNVMVGKFGEVQVMDWGLAKLLNAESATEEPKEEEHGTIIHTDAAETPSHVTRAGSGMGTPAYMPREQALGEWDRVDERADVFALGSILCEILTGKPAYTGKNGYEVQRLARYADLAETWQRLEPCGADAALVALCRDCLAPEREHRPRHAGVVAERVAAYQAEVQERLRQAELERVAAQTRAQAEQARAQVEQERTREALARAAAERRARQRLLALAGAVLVLLVGGGAGAWWVQQMRAATQARQEQANREALAGLERARTRLEEGWQEHDLARLAEARTEAERAADIARNGGASEAVHHQIAVVQGEAEERLHRAEKNQEFIRALLDIAAPHETSSYKANESGVLVLSAQPSVEKQYAAAFRKRWPELDMDNQPATEVAARLSEEPEVVSRRIIAGLDRWIVERRLQKRPERTWRRLLEVVEELDRSEQRRELRALLAALPAPRVEDVVSLVTVRPPWPALWEMTRGNLWRRLHQIRQRLNAAEESVLTVLLLSQACKALGDLEGAEGVLRQALARRPQEVSLLSNLAAVLVQQGPSHFPEAIGCCRAARASQPQLGIALSLALIISGQSAEAEAILRDLIRRQLGNPELLFSLGMALHGQLKYAEAEAVHRQTLTLKADFVLAHAGLGLALKEQGKLDEAKAAFRQAIHFKPDYAAAYNNIAEILIHQQQFAEAETVSRKALALQPQYAEALISLGSALFGQGKMEAAEAFCRQALTLNPRLPTAHNTLGLVLVDQGKSVEAEIAFRKAIELKPRYAEAHSNLSLALLAQGRPAEAEAACRKAFDFPFLVPIDRVKAFCALAVTLSHQKKLTEAEAVSRKAVALAPDLAAAHHVLGAILNEQGRPADAEVACRKAILLNPNYAPAYLDYGLALSHQRRPADAEKAYRKALALRPNSGIAYMNLGYALNDQGQFAAAEEACKKAIPLLPNNPLAYNNLGIALVGQGKLAEAEPAYRKAIALKADYAEALCGLGLALMGQERFSESLAAFRRGHELGSKQPGWRSPSRQWVRTAERLVPWENKLPQLHRGEVSFPNPQDAILLVQVWQLSKKHHVASARIYQEAFAADPRLAGNLDAQHRYNAACSAILAASAQEEDAHVLPDKVEVMFRRWALDWLRADLMAYARIAEQKRPEANQKMHLILTHWRVDPDLAAVRNASALDRLPDNERADWQALWHDVEVLTKRVAGKK